MGTGRGRRRAWLPEEKVRMGLEKAAMDDGLVGKVLDWAEAHVKKFWAR